MAHVREGAVALAALDLKLPGSASRAGPLRASGRRRASHVPAILVTGHADQEVVIRALRLGVPRFRAEVLRLHRVPARPPSTASWRRCASSASCAESELRLASVIGTTLDAILMCDAAGRVVLSNESAQQMFECSAADDAREQRVSRSYPGLGARHRRRAGPVPRAPRARGVRCGRARPCPIEVSVTDVVIQQQAAVHRDRARHHASGGAPRRSAARPTAQGRVPGDAGARAAQPAGRHHERGRGAAPASCPTPRMQKLTDVVRRQARVAGAHGGRPAGRLARHARQDRAEPRADAAGDRGHAGAWKASAIRRRPPASR